MKLLAVDCESTWYWELVYGRKPKASDITDLMFFSALNTLNYPRREGERWTSVKELQKNGLPFPEKVIRAKARTMIRKKRGLKGCWCGCRGDFELARELTVAEVIYIEMMRLMREAFIEEVLYGDGARDG